MLACSLLRCFVSNHKNNECSKQHKGVKMKVILSKVSLLGAIAMLTVSTANAQRHQRHRTGQHYNQYQQRGQVVHRVNKYMTHGDSINLKRAFQHKIGYNKKIVSLKIVGRSHSYNSKVVLKSASEGRIDVVNLSNSGRVQMLYLPAHVSLNGLKLVIKGSATIQRIIAQTVSTYGEGQAQLLKARVGIQTARGITLLPVKRIIKENTGVALRNKKIKAVVIKAKSLKRRYGQGSTIQVLVGGRAVGQPVYLGPEMQRVKIPLGYAQTQGTSIKLEVTGKTLVQMIGLRVKDKFGYDY